MKKIGAIILAIVMMTMCAAAWADVTTDGTTNQYKGIESNDTTLKIAKQIIFVNAEETTVWEPNITYTYTIKTTVPGTATTVTDSDGHSSPVKAGPIAAVTGATTATTSTVAFTDTTTASATANGTAKTKYASFTFDPSEFKVNDALTPGIYRYEIEETCSPTKASVGITESTGYASGRFLDVYVKWNSGRTALEIYGYVLFEGGGATTSIASTDTTMKSAGYVNTSETTGSQADVDVYTTQNLYISKTTTGAMAEKNHDFPITLTLSGPTGVSNVKMDVTKSGNGTLTTTNDTISAWGDVPGTVRDGSQIIIKGIPSGATASIVETNDTTDTYRVKAGTTSGAADLLTEAIVAASGTSSAIAATLSTKKEVFITNTLDTISPTGYVSRFAPYALMLIGGIVLLIVAKKHKKHHTDED